MREEKNVLIFLKAMQMWDYEIIFLVPLPNSCKGGRKVGAGGKRKK